MPDGELRFALIIDAQTAAIKNVQQELSGLTEALGKKIPDAGKEAGSAFASVGSIVKGIGLASLLQGAASAAFKSSQSMQEFKDQLDITVDALVDDLEPALSMISRGLQGLLIVVGGLGGIVSNILKGLTGSLSAFFSGITNMAASAMLAIQGDFRGAFEAGKEGLKDFAKTATSFVDQDWKGATERLVSSWGNGMDRMEGKTKVTLEKQLELLMANTRTQLADVTRSVKQRLGIVDAAEKAAGTMLRESAKFQAGTELEKEVLIANQRAEFASLRKRLLSADLADEQKIRDERFNAELEAIRAAADAKMQLEADTFDQKVEILDQRQADELALLASYREQGLVDQAAYEQRVLQITSKAAGDKAKMALEDQKQTQKSREAFFQATIQSAVGAASQELVQSRNAGRALRAAGAEAVKTMANQASTAIAIEGAKATARSFASAGGFPLGIPAAVATMAFYAGLATIVSAAGGAAAAKMAPPPSEGGGGGAGASGGATGGAAAGVSEPGQAATVVGEGAVPGAVVDKSIQVSVTMLDGTMAPEAGLNVAAAISKAAR